MPTEDKAPEQMTGAVEDVGKPLALTGLIVELCSVLEDVNGDAFSVDLCDPQLRVSC